MVYLSTIEEWQQKSALLLQARPTTAKITTKYKIPNLDSPKYQTKKRKRDADTEGKDAAAAAPRVPKAWLVLKTYCPESGVVLKFKTDKQADVGRLIGGLGRLGRHMAALPEKAEAPVETATEDVPVSDAGAMPAKETATSTSDEKLQQTAGSGGGGGGKKKKKGKK